MRPCVPLMWAVQSRILWSGRLNSRATSSPAMPLNLLHNLESSLRPPLSTPAHSWSPRPGPTSTECSGRGGEPDLDRVPSGDREQRASDTGDVLLPAVDATHKAEAWGLVRSDSAVDGGDCDLGGE